MIEPLTDQDLLPFNKTPIRNRACAIMTNLLVKANLEINKILHRDSRKDMLKFLNQIGGSFDLMENSLIGEAIIVHSLMIRSSTYLEERI